MGIIVKDLCKKFGNFVAVDHVSFKVNAGELVALLGPSGCGKSTILRIIAGLEKPDSGQVLLSDQNVTQLAPQKRRVGFVFQHYALFKHLTVTKNIAFGMEIQKKSKEEIKQKVEELLDLVKLKGFENLYPDQLSGGQRQRVALARALATEPRVLLLDEPFGALDAKVRENLVQWLRDFHKKSGITALFVTHDQSEAMEISDKIVVINKGKVIQTGEAREVYEHPNSKFVASFIGQVNVLDGHLIGNHIHLLQSQIKIPKPGNVSHPDGPVVLFIRPEDILIHKTHHNDSFIPVTIRRIHYRGDHYLLICQVNGLQIKLIHPKNNHLIDHWHENQTVFLELKAMRIYSADEGFETIWESFKEKGYFE